MIIDSMSPLLMRLVQNSEIVQFGTNAIPYSTPVGNTCLGSKIVLEALGRKVISILVGEAMPVVKCLRILNAALKPV